ncbi:hypothetical protein PGC35_02430 [Psychrobacillus sp. PGGUH221]|uniref:hypothetical protein n=1 Tax=Psychrobacillus sp. PGGUH221 TaxID=3020058 RepID=UPI0035C6AB97
MHPKEFLTGTIKIDDGMGRSAVVKVNYVDGNSLKVEDFIKLELGYNNSSYLRIIDATGLVNQDQLEYRVEGSNSTIN